MDVQVGPDSHVTSCNNEGRCQALEHTKWYVADIVSEFTISECDGNIVHIDTVLIRADSPEQAYEKAVRNGKDREDFYANPQGASVTVRFRGLQELVAVDDAELVDGTELRFKRVANVTEPELSNLTVGKQLLRVFSVEIPYHQDDCGGPTAPPLEQ